MGDKDLIMKCATHHEDATGICVNCGIVLCPTCATKSMSGRYVCSASCSEAKNKEELALNLILEKASKGSTTTAFFCFLMGGLFAVVGVFTILFDIWQAGLFLELMAIGYIIGGVAYRRIGKRAVLPTTSTKSLLPRFPLCPL
jgi:hypothetical protein